MQTTKYAVWFHGTADEQPGICYQGREPFITDNREFALQYKHDLQVQLKLLEGTTNQHLFSVCEIHISNNLIKD